MVVVCHLCHKEAVCHQDASGEGVICLVGSVCRSNHMDRGLYCMDEILEGEGKDHRGHVLP